MTKAKPKARGITHTTVIRGLRNGYAIEARIGTPITNVSVTMDSPHGAFEVPEGDTRDGTFGALIVQLAHGSYESRTDHDGVTTFHLGEIRI